ncbi:MAG TPA: YdeI/OmpD-associated family protein [Candidatus Dormibacteraeota bacterium]|nr:YdeI/OmpD-associated family protein [Candidatus Dormibacteraeota bacterium]
MRFRAKILQSGKTAAGIEVPAKVVAALGSSKRPPVRATINGFTYRSSVASMGGKFMLGVPPEFRDGAGVAAGDMVDIDLEVDTKPREVPVPVDFAAALERDARAKKTFDALSYSNKRRLLIPIDEIKSAETRERRIAKTMAMLSEGRS